MDPLRIFGLVIAGVIGIVAIVSAPRMTGPSPWALGIAALVAAVALAMPAALRPAHAAWLTVARALAWLNTRVLLGLVFYLVFTPLGIAMRLAGRDALRLTFDPDATTYAEPRRSRAGDHMRRLF